MKKIGAIFLVAVALFVFADSVRAQCPRQGGGNAGGGVQVGSPAIAVNVDISWGPQTYIGQGSYARQQIARQFAFQQYLQKRAALTAAIKARDFQRDQQRIATRRLNREQTVAAREARKTQAKDRGAPSKTELEAPEPNASPTGIAAVLRARR